MANPPTLRTFLEQIVPKKNQDNIESIIIALDEAGKRYERYAATRPQWRSSSDRKDKLAKIVKSAKQLHSDFAALDLISTDNLAKIVGEYEVEKLQAQLSRLIAKIPEQSKSIQHRGRTTDLAIWKWVRDVAQIYEVNTGRKAKVYGSGSETEKKRGPFHQLLQLCRPKSYPRYNAPDLKQLNRILNSTKNY